MSIYFVDEVQITPITRNPSFRTETEGTQLTSVAYVEEEDSIVYSDGMPVRPARRIFLPYNTQISIGDLIKITKLKGQLISDTDKKVVSIFKTGSFKGSHLEVVA